MEANPGTVTRDRLAAYRDAGVTRISLGAPVLPGAAPADARTRPLPGGDARGGGGGAARRLRQREPRSHLRGAGPDARDVDRRSRPGAGARPGSRLRLCAHLGGGDALPRLARAGATSSPSTTISRARWRMSPTSTSPPPAPLATRSRAGRAPASNRATTPTTGTAATTSVSGRAPTRSAPRGPRLGDGGIVRLPQGWRAAVAARGIAVDGEESFSSMRRRGRLRRRRPPPPGRRDVAEFERRFTESPCWPPSRSSPHLASDGLVQIDGRLPAAHAARPAFRRHGRRVPGVRAAASRDSPPRARAQ